MDLELLLYLFLSFWTFLFAIIVLYLLYRYTRHKIHVKVTCWFCHHVSKVPYIDANCWDCPSCEQYNGFTKDGDYNKTIPSMYDSVLNNSSGSCQPAEFLSFGDQLCNRCNTNTRIKTKLLAEYQPINEANYDQEIEIYAKRLEKWYDLCLDCQSTVTQELQKQDSLLLQKLRSCGQDFQLDNTWGIYNQSPHISQSPFISSKSVMNKMKQNSHKIFELSSILCLLGLSIQNVLDIEPDLQIYKQLPWICFDHHTLTVIYIVGCCTDIISKIILVSKGLRLYIVDISIFSWIVIYLLKFVYTQWTSPNIDLCLCIVTLVFLSCSFMLRRTDIVKRRIKIKRSPLSSSHVSSTNTESLKNSTSNNSAADVSTSLRSFEDTVSGLDAFSFGTPTRRRKIPGVFESRFTTPGKTMPFPERLSARKPMISPAKLNVLKFSSKSKEVVESQPPSKCNELVLCTKPESDIVNSTAKTTSWLEKVQKTGDEGSEESSSSRSSVCPLDSTTTLACPSDSTMTLVCPVDSTTTLTSDDNHKGSWLKKRHVVYLTVLFASLGFNAYLTWWISH